jgi:hypothetical protein
MKDLCGKHQMGRLPCTKRLGHAGPCAQKFAPLPGVSEFEAEVNRPIAPEYVPEAPAVPVFMSADSAVRKSMPIATGVLAYFPDALLLVAFISRLGNDKHNPGQPLHWAKEKSTDEPDCEVRHMLDGFRKLPPDPGLEALGQLSHKASKAWRALADLQRACDAERTAYEATVDR